MDRKLASGTLAFALLSVLLGVGIDVLMEFLAGKASLAGLAGQFLVVMPSALIGRRRLGRLTHASVFAASAVLAAALYWFVLVVLNAIGAPMGATHVGWSHLFTPMNWERTALGLVAILLVPQLWLALFNHLAANNSSKPTPLRGAA